MNLIIEITKCVHKTFNLLILNTKYVSNMCSVEIQNTLLLQKLWKLKKKSISNMYSPIQNLV